MPDLPLPQLIYLVGVIIAFSTFMIVLAYGAIRTRAPAARAPARASAAAPVHGQLAK